MSLLRSRLNKIEKAVSAGTDIHLVADQSDFIFKMLYGNQGPYVPSDTGLKFHRDDSSVRLILGPFGSGKSTICCADILFRSLAMPASNDGVRRSRWAIVRNTCGDLEATTLKTWLEWFSTLGIINRRSTPRLTYIHTFNDGGKPIELELMFVALDRPDDVRKLKSLELTGVYLNELSEIPQAALWHFKTRILRFPSSRDCSQPYWSGIIADTNPPETDHWIYRLFEISKPEGYKIFHQPPAVLKVDDEYVVNLKADNIEHLREKGDGLYYRQMIQGQTEEFIKVYAMGHYGTVVHGKPVFPQYNDDIHSVDTIEIDIYEPILLSWDYGTISPACLVVQQTKDGFIHLIKEFVCEYMTVKELASQMVLPWLTKYAKGLSLECTGDPANTYDGSEQLAELELHVERANTNYIGPRIAAVTENLNTLVNGKAKMILSREGCPKLRQGFLGKYAYRRLRVVGEEKYQDVPNKTHPYSDCFAAGTKITMADFSQKSIENVKIGDYVQTPSGAKKVTNAWMARENANVYQYSFSNNHSFVATPDHRIKTERGWVKLCNIMDDDVLYSISKTKDALKHVGESVYQGQKNVYDLTVEDEHCFYANGILVHNCHDCLQYACLYYKPEIKSLFDDQFDEFDEYDESTRSSVGGY